MLRQKHTLFLRSKEVVNCGWNRGERIALILRCKEKKTSLYFDTVCHMASSDYNDYGDVTYRLDADKARTVGMSESTDNKAVGLWSGGKSIPVIKQMLGKNEMVVRMTPYGQSPFTASFKIAGLSDAIKPIREECKW
ncbi:type VI secretion system-associated protein TagO [Brucella sp. TWI559]